MTSDQDAFVVGYRSPKSPSVRFPQSLECALFPPISIAVHKKTPVGMGVKWLNVPRSAFRGSRYPNSDWPSRAHLGGEGLSGGR